MNTITASSVQEAFSDAFYLLRVEGVAERSRAGDVLAMPGPVVTIYTDPIRRVLLDPRRDCNHAFHLAEAVWVFAGQGDSRFLEQFNPRYREYAEETGLVWGAYGPRWRGHWGFDQLAIIAMMLRINPDTRRAVLEMWSPADDLGVVRNDLPCNTHVYFSPRGGVLDMTVCCRSNDALWGAYGTNVVVFSMLLEWMAGASGLKMGKYYQFSNNFHCYPAHAQQFLDTPPEYSLEGEGYEICTGLGVYDMGSAERFLIECQALCNNLETRGLDNAFLRETVQPILLHFLARKKDRSVPYVPRAGTEDQDWVIAYRQWLARRAA